MDGRRLLREHVTLEVEGRPPLGGPWRRMRAMNTHFFSPFHDLSAFSSMSPRLRGERPADTTQSL